MNNNQDSLGLGFEMSANYVNGRNGQCDYMHRFILEEANHGDTSTDRRRVRPISTLNCVRRFPFHNSAHRMGSYK